MAYQWANPEEYISHTDYLTYMFGQTPGLIARGVISNKQNGEYRESFYFSERLITQNRYFGVNNVYVSMNSFLTRHKRYDDNSGRKVNNLKRLNALYLDLDCYKIGLTQEQVVHELETKYFGVKIPHPTFVINSGRGVYLIWKIDEDRNALPRWKHVQNYLFEQCRHFNADPKAIDAARVLRVPNSINGNNGEPVRIMRFKDVRYTLYSIIKEYGIKPKTSRQNKITYPYGQATDKQRKVAKWQSEQLGIELPDFDNYPETFEYIRKNGALRGIRATASKKNKSMESILEGRVNDLFKLFSMRRSGDGIGREIGLFLCRLWTAERTGDYAYALERTKALNRIFSIPHDEKYVETRTKSAESILKQGNSYKYKLSTIIDLLDITEAEQRELDFLRRIPRFKAERKKEDNRRRYLNKLKSENKQTKQDIIIQRRKTIARMLSEGKSQADICVCFGISARTYARDKAAIEASNKAEQITTDKKVIKNKQKTNEKRTVKNAQGGVLPFFKPVYYKGSLASASSSLFLDAPITWWELWGALGVLDCFSFEGNGADGGTLPNSS